ncbi:hypothetical protein PR048_033397 [Dryococelus australis]|uniref:Uncharacterized protein n=1 Tax=Dryococelus australis TaxID=614101 RepID=A0ABQ9G4C3_9NEOP|nr:hypothetical protein PR048_033397 [Dryococelus australis]
MEHDKLLWKHHMLPKLKKKFYEDFVLPQLAYPRSPRGMKARNPDATPLWTGLMTLRLYLDDNQKWPP